jgi:hypothetical protein
MVTNFVAHGARSQQIAQQNLLPLSFELGEAFQFDWSDESLVVGGIFYRCRSHI